MIADFCVVLFYMGLLTLMLLQSAYIMHAMGAYRLELDAKTDHQKLKKQHHELKYTCATMESSKKKVGELDAFCDLHKPKLEQ